MAQRSVVQRLRQHHAIEHATVTLLSQRLPGAQLVARSDLVGFIVFGELEIGVLRATAEQALVRLQAGETNLAVHPNCGTNLVTAGILAGAAAVAAGSGRRHRSAWDRLPSAMLAAMLALLAAAPAGRWMQEHVTTSGEVAGLRVVDVVRLDGRPLLHHRVLIGE